MKGKIYATIIVVMLVPLLVLPLTTGCAKPAGPINLEAVTFCDAASNDAWTFMTFMDKVNERAKGELTIKRIGGPEVVPLFEFGTAAKEGVIDIAYVFPPAYVPIVPGAEVIFFSEITKEEEQQQGVYDILGEMHERAGLFLLGMVKSGPPKGHFYIFLNKRVETPYDLAGIKIAAEMTADPFMKALGLVPLNVPDPEIYTGLERGLLDAYHNPLTRCLDFGLQEVTKYVINHPFYHGRVATMVNLGTWNGIPEHLQDLMKEAMAEAEREYESRVPELEAELWQKLLDAGVEPIEFSPTDAEWYLDAIYGAAWEQALEDYPEVAPRLKPLLTK